MENIPCLFNYRTRLGYKLLYNKSLNELYFEDNETNKLSLSKLMKESKLYLLILNFSYHRT